MSKESKRKLKAFTMEEKLNIIDRIHKGARQAEIAREFNLAESTLRGWIKNEGKLRQFVDSVDTDKGLARNKYTVLRVIKDMFKLSIYLKKEQCRTVYAVQLNAVNHCIIAHCTD